MSLTMQAVEAAQSPRINSPPPTFLRSTVPGHVQASFGLSPEGVRANNIANEIHLSTNFASTQAVTLGSMVRDFSPILWTRAGGEHESERYTTGRVLSFHQPRSASLAIESKLFFAPLNYRHIFFTFKSLPLQSPIVGFPVSVAVAQERRHTV